MGELAVALNEALLASVRARHRLVSAHRCRCGWEGSDVIVHLFDAIADAATLLEDERAGCGPIREGRDG